MWCEDGVNKQRRHLVWRHHGPPRTQMQRDDDPLQPLSCVSQLTCPKIKVCKAICRAKCWLSVPAFPGSDCQKESRVAIVSESRLASLNPSLLCPNYRTPECYLNPPSTHRLSSFFLSTPHTTSTQTYQVPNQSSIPSNSSRNSLKIHQSGNWLAVFHRCASHSPSLCSQHELHHLQHHLCGQARSQASMR